MEIRVQYLEYQLQVQADDETTSLHVLYMGAVGSLLNQPVLDMSDTLKKGSRSLMVMVMIVAVNHRCIPS